MKKYYSLNLDEWTRYNYNFIGITITFDDCYYLLCLNAPDDLSRSADVIARVFKDSLSFYNIKNDKIIFTSIDSASSVKKAINISGIKLIPYCVHILNCTFLIGYQMIFFFKVLLRNYHYYTIRLNINNI